MSAPRRTCSARRSPWPSRTRPAAARSASSGPKAASAARQKRARSASRRAGAPAAASVVRVSSTTAARRSALSPGSTGATAWKPATAAPTATRSASTARPWARLGGQGRGFVVAVHRDGVLDGARIVRRRHGQAVRTARHQGDHSAVDACREAAVEPQLGVAACPPACERAVVDEREANGLLDLVRGLAGEEDPRDVGLAQLNRLGAVRVGGGVQESIRQAGRVLQRRRRGTACGWCGGSHEFRS